MSTPIRWQVPIELSPEEARVAAVPHRTGKFYMFLRKVRVELFDDVFQAELAAVSASTARNPPVPMSGFNQISRWQLRWRRAI
jgi:hypothetical protein